MFLIFGFSLVKKSSLFCFILFLVSISAFSQDKNCLQDIGDKMCLVSTEGKYGVMSKKGDYIVPAYFDTVIVFGQGFMVKQNGKMGVIDRKGRIAIPVEFPFVKCVGECEKDFLFEISDIGMKAIYITKDLNKVYGYQKVTPTLIASQTEITIKDWFAYVKDVQDNGYNYNYGFEETIPDTNKVEQKLLPAYRAFISVIQNEDLCGVASNVNFSYLTSWKISSCFNDQLLPIKNESMINFPVTGLTYKQVQRYTEWLTFIYKTQVNEEQDLPYEINFRLPKIEEWEKMASLGLSEQMRKNNCLDSLNKEGCMLINFNASNTCKNYDDYLKYSFGKGSAFVNSFNPDNNGIYNIFGNVAEMVFENGLAKGGSYSHSAKKCALNSTMEYENAEPWLGFRLVAEFKAKE
jgi:formylglycine-generating enzyme required for sulfatase activity